MFVYRRIVPVVLLVLGACALAACQGGGAADSEFTWLPLFGDNGADTSPVIATVAGAEITEEDLELRYDELPPQMQRRYDGEEGRRLLLRNMVEQVLMARGAVDRELFNDRQVARSLISQRRSLLDQAMRNLGLFRDAKASDEQLQAFFMANRDHYTVQGRVRARHVECLTRADADRAYERLMAGGRENTFPFVSAELSVNQKTRELEGELGWFNKGGFVPHVRNSDQISTLAFDMPAGLHAPLQIGDRWHVLEILNREESRPMTFNEARGQVEQDYLPTFQEELVEAYLTEARTKYPVQMMGRYAPGGGISDEALFQRAVMITDPERQHEVLTLLIDEFPDSDRADDALFLAAHAVMDRWQDRRIAGQYLRRLLDEHPNSEMVEDARYLLDNIDNPKAWAPQSIEDLRR